eukprot:CAMPEP_0174373102 /NCGR_PEP_ID=MMETSP0811_2-20130205/105790_1 /TAXON_ID=73025 ORGANISM="Eutreptiella gymnastica-like, Strain CCMP1594" /NCGR_SAMPLE_ID=MMETSP0811_2 /ASSEMBLY_ACC=CAM_ASM_000667 /LENGTH=120 /DNA_ID=CAMNT_0015521089 /DNA_START=994 /DNA_END=1353 /DNA_ORIENTATION=-
MVGPIIPLGVRMVFRGNQGHVQDFDKQEFVSVLLWLIKNSNTEPETTTTHSFMLILPKSGKGSLSVAGTRVCGFMGILVSVSTCISVQSGARFIAQSQYLKLKMQPLLPALPGFGIRTAW